jgi:hypothetical protein
MLVLLNKSNYCYNYQPDLEGTKELTLLERLKALDKAEAAAIQRVTQTNKTSECSSLTDAVNAKQAELNLPMLKVN